MIARDELAARCYLALLTPTSATSPVEEWDYGALATLGIKAADALLSALAVPPAAPAPSPTSYVPRVGDVVALTVDDVTDGPLPYRDSLGAHLYRVNRALRDDNGCLECVRVDGRDTTIPCYISSGAMRPATASERKAAGLPVDEATPPPAAASVEPRRTVGAVVKAPSDDIEFIVVNPGEGESCVRAITACVSVAPGFTRGSDRFVRWATRAECEKHGVPFVDRTPPAATPAYPVDAAGRPLWVRITSLNGDVAKPAILTIGRVYRVTAWGDFGSPAVTTDDGRRDWYLSRKGTEPDPDFNTYASWEPCAAPTDAVPPAAALTEEERVDLACTIRKGRMGNLATAWRDIGDDARADWLRTADAAAAWFAKRDGTVKP